MSIIENKVIENYEEDNKKALYGFIKETTAKVSDLLTEIEESNKYIPINSYIPNIGFTFYNKLNMTMKEFKVAGLAMFAQEINGFPTVSYVGTAILEELQSKLSKAIEALERYNASLKKMIIKKGPIGKLIFNIKSMFSSNVSIANEEEIKEISSHLLVYMEKDREITGFYIDGNIVPVIVKRIMSERDTMSKTGFSEEDILVSEVDPVLKALGLESLIPKLREELKKQLENQEHSKNPPSWELTQEQREQIRPLHNVGDVQKVDEHQTGTEIEQ